MFTSEAQGHAVGFLDALTGNGFPASWGGEYKAAPTIARSGFSKQPIVPAIYQRIVNRRIFLALQPIDSRIGLIFWKNGCREH